MAITVNQQGAAGAATTPQGLNNNLYTLTDPTKYTSLYEFIDEVNMPDNRSNLIKTFGKQGISGFLELTGAVKAEGTNDEVTTWEEARLHQIQTATAPVDAVGNVGEMTFSGTIQADDTSTPFVDATSNPLVARVGDILLINGVDRIWVSELDGTTGFKAFPLTALTVATTAISYDMPIVGNMYAQASDQPADHIESNLMKRTNPFAIVKDTYKVSGSQATNLGWVDLGGGDYRWYIKGEADTRQRFKDACELVMLTGEQVTNTANITTHSGTEGYFQALEDRGLVTSDLIGSAGLADIDALIKEMDKNGAPPEYAVYSNTKQDLMLDDMVASGVAGPAALTSTSYGAFNNDKDMALNLGFKSFSRGGYTFHKNSFKILNDPTLLGNDTIAEKLCAGVMIPLANVVDPKTGDRAPALEKNYKSTNGYSREMEHWVTGSILGFTNDTNDYAKFNYRSECCLVTRAANQHVLIQGS